VTESQLELLWFRDRHCTFPGCESTWFVEAHHIRHWADGGKTTLENLTLLCSAHHRRLHEGGWTIPRATRQGPSVPRSGSSARGRRGLIPLSPSLAGCRTLGVACPSWNRTYVRSWEEGTCSRTCIAGRTSR
jgi:hypothetical protein